MTKEKVSKVIQDLPEVFDLEELIGRLISIEKVEKLQQSNLYKTYSFQKARELLQDYKGSFSDAVIEERREE